MKDLLKEIIIIFTIVFTIFILVIVCKEGINISIGSMQDSNFLRLELNPLFKI